MRWWFAFLVACGPVEATDEPPTPCGSDAPSFTHLTIEDGGVKDFASGRYPSVVIRLAATDPDGALTSYTFSVGFDDELDGEVDMSDPIDATGSFGPHDCSVPAADLFVEIAISGAPAPNTNTEFGVVLIDADGNDTGPPEIITFVTPTL